MSPEQFPKPDAEPILQPEYETVGEALLIKYDELGIEWNALAKEVERHHSSLKDLARVYPLDAHLQTIQEASQELDRLRRRQHQILDQQSEIEAQFLRVIRSPIP